MNNQYDVIIIGAGISGMSAAHTILEREPSLDILILEAKGRIGGRTLSLPVRVKNNNTCLFDFGAHWVSTSQLHLQKFLKLLNLHVVPQQRGLSIGVPKTDSFRTYQEHPLISNVFSNYEIKWFFAWFEEQSEKFEFDAIRNNFISEFYDCTTMECYINSKIYTTEAKNVIKNIIKSTTGVEATQISVMFYLLLCHSTLGFTNQYMCKEGGSREFWIQEGAQEICNRLKNIIGEECILLKQPVIEINYSKPHDMEVLTASGKKYRSSNIICAIPPDQLFKINFVPALSRQKKKVLEEIQVGHLTKFVITYNTPFWRYQGYSGEIFACKDGPISICYDATKNENPALIGYIREPINITKGTMLTRIHMSQITLSAWESREWQDTRSFKLDKSCHFNVSLDTDEKMLMPDGTYRNSVIQQLKKYWGKDATIYIDYKEISWCDEPYVGGCPMSCSGIGSLKYHYMLTQPLGRIHWAGAETATDWNGYMNGAIQSGYRAAINVLYDMRPQSITYDDITYIGYKYFFFEHSNYEYKL